MKENSIEEDIKNIEEIIELSKKEIDTKDENITAILDIEDLISLEDILSSYKKALKENEELKSNNEKYTIHLADKQYNVVIENAQNDINQKWIQKVKDKIRHYQELQDNYIKKYDEINEGLQAMINVLQELIEEREEK